MLSSCKWKSSEAKPMKTIKNIKLAYVFMGKTHSFAKNPQICACIRLLINNLSRNLIELKCKIEAAYVKLYWQYKIALKIKIHTHQLYYTKHIYSST